MDPSGPARFDAEAATWDSNPTTVVSSNKFFQFLCDRVPGLRENANKTANAIEIGCGTGLLSSRVAPRLAEYYAYDTSNGMLNMLRAKIDKSPELANIKPVMELLTDANSPSLDGRRFDFAFSHLVIHHIPLDALQTTYDLLYAVMRPGGRVYLSDFEFTDESALFHPKAKHYDVVQHGIRRDDFIQGLKSAGFEEVRVDHSFDLPKPCEDGKTRDFPFIVASGLRR